MNPIISKPIYLFSIAFFLCSPDLLLAQKSPDAAPNYKIVFPEKKVNTIEITLNQNQWDSIRTDMKEKYGNDFGESRPPMGGGRPPMPPAGAPTGPFGPPPDFADRGMMQFGKGEPKYFSVSVKFKDKVYSNTGFRLKGNSSLTQAWGRGIYKLPFRLDFGRYVKQDLYGFRTVSFSPGINDKSLIREKVTADIFRQAGIPAAQTAFYKVYIDFGEGKKYCGIYTLVEVIEDTMVKTQFGEDKGNIYKPESSFTKFKAEQFEKKNNKKQANWQDVQAFIKALNDSTRLTDDVTWRTNLEKTFNVDHFIKWLAINTTIVNWDTYGVLPHNFYLYNSPTHKLTWIPWDNDLALDAKMEMPEGFKPPDGFKTPEGFKPPEGFPPPMRGGTMGRSTSLSLKEVGKNWPLIKLIADDVFYYAKYKQYVKEFAESIFTPVRMNTLFEQNHKLIAPYVKGKEKEQMPYSFLKNTEDFKNELAHLKEHVVKRNKEVILFLK